MRQLRTSRVAMPWSIALIVASIALTTLACGSSGKRIDPLLQLSAQEALAMGKELLEAKKYARAQRYLEHAFEAAPNSREGREALLLAADALYQRGGTESFVRCEAKYRDFINRFPTSERSDYAQLQIANCLAKRMEKPDRDQEVALKALEAYEEMFRLYPTSDLIPEARAQARVVTNNLAESEFLVGTFYIRYRLCRAAVERLAGLPERYPSYEQIDKALYFLAQAYGMCNQPDEAEETLLKLEREYPDSPYVAQLDEARAKLTKLGKELAKRMAAADQRRQKLARPAAEADDPDEQKTDETADAEEEGEEG